MQTRPIVSALIWAFVLSACNDVSRSGNEATESRNTVALAPRQETQNTTLPEAVPVPPASASPVVAGTVESPAASAGTPVESLAKPDAATAASETSDASPSAPSTNPDGSNAATDSAATNPRGTLTKDQEAKSMPLAGHGNNHSSPSLEQPETK